MIFFFLLTLHIVFALCFGFGFLFLRESNRPFWEKLPRAKVPGAILGFLALLGFLPNVEPMFPMESNLFWLVPAALLLSFACFLYIDYLFARALAGALIVTAHASLAEGYASALPGESIFAICCFIAGIFGIVISAKPGYLRDLFRKAANSPLLRVGIFIYCLVWLGTAVNLLIRSGGAQ